MIQRSLIPSVVCCLLLSVASKASATDEDPINRALPAAEAWLEMIDAGQFAESYDAAGQGLYVKVPEKKDWIVAVKTMRSTWGKVISRKETRHSYQPTGIVGLNGECMAIEFETTTEKDALKSELVILRFEDGKWRGVGYTMRQKIDDGAQSLAPPVTETTSQTIPGKTN